MGKIRSLAAGAVRIAGRPFLTALLAAPRRQFNIPRLTRRREFRALHRDTVAWLDRHFGLIEQGAPWLRRVGSDVWDFCRGGVSNRVLELEGGSRPGVGCIREVTAVYGFDGPLTARLRSLDQAMPAAGWEMAGLAARQTWRDLDVGSAATAEGLAGHRTRWMTDRRVSLRWRPAAALSYPPGSDGMPPWGQPDMRVTWSSRGQETGLRRDPNKTRSTTRNYLALEASEAGAPELLEQALARYEHALTVTINLAYFPTAEQLRRRVPRYWLPTRAR